MSHRNSEAVSQQQTRVIRRQNEPDPTPPSDHDDYKRSQELSFRASRKSIEKRRKKSG